MDDIDLPLLPILMAQLNTAQLDDLGEHLGCPRGELRDTSYALRLADLMEDQDVLLHEEEQPDVF